MGIRILITTQNKRENSFVKYYNNALGKCGMNLSGSDSIHYTSTADPISLKGFDALLLGGGCPINPLSYGSNIVLPSHLKSSRLRDSLEMHLYRSARQEGIPILGICRGMGVINISEGGSQYAYIPRVFAHQSHDHSWTEDRDNLPKDYRTAIKHKIVLSEYINKSSQTLLYRSLEGAEIDGKYEGNYIGVNSMHKQGIKTLGRGLLSVATDNETYKVTAAERLTQDREIDCVVMKAGEWLTTDYNRPLPEAIELKDCSQYLLGVQFHPDAFVDEDSRVGRFSRNIFKSFVDSARVYSNQRREVNTYANPVKQAR